MTKKVGHCRRCGGEFSLWLAIHNWCTPCLYSAVNTLKDVKKSYTARKPV